ncbi:nitroreductase family protein [Clostridium massiliamazoniense]|uniref:nitroreductase family protein n=1 Tax=Clostridium massiliamazoniense TaxID=1347366 RepID=UPI0006D8201A|nr:nitroreductase family protein [Clostridium massiliamazoniense]
MFENISKTQSDALEDILKARRSVRLFSTIPPDKKDIEQIIQAGLIAPFASVPAKGKRDFRKIIIIPTDSNAMTKIESIIKVVSLKHFGEMKEKNAMASSVMKKLESGDVTDLFGNAPYLIIAAERKGKGFPFTYETEQSISLSYCMYNMWLKATSLKIGFKLVSIFVHLKLGNNKEFCELLGIQCGEYAIDACAIGYPDDKYKLPQVNYPNYESNTTWL